MATFRKRGQKWQAQVRLKGHTPLSRSFTLKGDAEAWARQAEASLERSDIPPSIRSLRSLSLLSLLERYEERITPRKKSAPAEKYLLRTIKAHPLTSLSLDRLTSAAITGYRDDRLSLVSASSVRRELAVLQHCLELARKEWGVALPKNPVADIAKPPQALARERRITTQEMERLRSALAGSRNGLLANVFFFAIHTGMRRSELLSIHWSNIDIENFTVHLAETKNGHPRTVPLSPAAIAALPVRPGGASADRLVFPLSPNALRLAWERLKRRAGVEDLHFHDLRHEAISRFFEMGLTIPEVSLISGHKDARMLFRYTHLKAADLAKKLRTRAWV